MQPALPAGFVFQTVVTSAKTRLEARRSASSSSGSMVLRGFPGLAGAHLCRPCRNYARYRFGDQAAGAVDLVAIRRWELQPAPAREMRPWVGDQVLTFGA